MKIGITERGDPSLDFSWVEKMDKLDGAVIITKNLTDKILTEASPYFQKTVFHVTCTGYGGTVVEPNIPKYEHQLQQAKKLLDMVKNSERVVIRIDPVIPTRKGLVTAEKVFCEAARLGFRRFRVSLMDAYPHVRKRFKEAGLPSPYGENKFSPSKEHINAMNMMLKRLKTELNISIEACAEPGLSQVKHTGCIGEKDLQLMGLNPTDFKQGGYQRSGCLCCTAKTELLSQKKQCPYGCLYCYWREGV